LWYLYKGIILTKDNLAKRQWQGDKKCCFCSSEEFIQHLLFDCPFVKFVWRTIHISFNLTSPTSVHNMFTDWLHGFHRELKSKILVGANAICWVIWLTRNNEVFNKVLAPSYLQVIFRGTYWIRFWSLLQKEEDRQMMKIGCRKIETIAMKVFARNGWRFSNRIMF
jgi:hypothetical protein